MNTSRSTAWALATNSGAASGWKQRCHNDRTRNQRGNALVEISLVLPIMMMLVTGMAAVGLAINQYSVLTNCAQIAAAQLSVSRGQVPSNDPCSLIVTAVTTAQQGLPVASLGYSLAFAPPTTGIPSFGTPLTGTGSAFTCVTSNSSMLKGGSIQVIVSMPSFNITMYGYNVFPNLVLKARVSEMIQ